MKKLNLIMTAVLVSAVSVASFASASEGILKANVHTDAAVSAQTKTHNEASEDSDSLMERIKNVFDFGTRSGTVSQLNSDGSFTIQKGDESATVKTTASTSFEKNGEPSTKASVVVGAMVKVKGAFDKATATITASLVNIIQKLQGIHISGSVTAVSGTTVTVKANDGTVYTVDASKAHVFHSFWFGSSGDIKVGDSVAIWGTHLKGSTSIAARWFRDISVKSAAEVSHSPSPSPSVSPSPSPTPAQ